jgi:pimeloyl-ACP methyl ester carboxylesterase
LSARLHLVGHSFGGLLVSAVTNEYPDGKKNASLTLLQGAFSDNAFATGYMYQDVVEKGAISGPIVVTHTKKNDWELSTAYPIAAWWFKERGLKQPGEMMRVLEDGVFGAVGSHGARKVQKSPRE